MRYAFLLASVLLLSSCEAKFDWPWLKDQPQITHVQRSGKTVTEDRVVEPFTKVRLEGLGKLVFDDTIPPNIVRVVADQSVLSAIRTEINGSELSLKEEGISGPGSWELEYRLAAPAGLEEVLLSGMGSIDSTSVLKTGDLTLALDGMGKIQLEIQAQDVVVRQQGQGEVMVTGTADQVEVRADGLGKVDLAKLIAKKADVESNGVGEVLVYASEKLKVRANGLGAVRFWGHPASTDVQTEGLTQVSASD
jgi:hypothetical protein